MSINDLLENIRILLKYILSRKMKKVKLKNKWRMVKLEDICGEFRNIYEPNQDDMLAYLGMEHIEQQTLQIGSIGKSSDTESSKYKFKSGDILFGKLRPYFRKVIIPKFDGVCSTEFAVIRSKNGNNQRFIYYLMANNNFINAVNQTTQGTRMPRAKWNIMGKLKVTIPENIKIQKKIVSILSAYDDLIENNTKRIKILEETAQAIYKEWFVNFHFPGYEKVKMIDSGSEFEKVPEGWEVKRIDNLVNIKKNKFIKNKHESLPLLDMARIPRKSFAISMFGNSNELTTARIIFNKYDILFGSIRPYFHKVIFALDSGVTNTSVFVLETKEKELLSFSISLFFNEETVKFAVQNSGGTKMPVIKWNILKNMEYVHPSKKTVKQFNKITMPVLEEIVNLNNQNQNLRQTRDLLLPKLVGGEIEI